MAAWKEERIEAAQIALALQLSGCSTIGKSGRGAGGCSFAKPGVPRFKDGAAMRNPDWWKSIALCGLVIPGMMAERRQGPGSLGAVHLPACRAKLSPERNPDSDKRCGGA